MLPLCPLVCLCEKLTWLYQWTHVPSNPGIGGKVCCTLSCSILVHQFLLNFCILGFSSVFTFNVVCYSLHCDFIFFGFCASNVVWAYMWFWCVCRVHFKHFGCIIEFCHMVDSGSGIIFVCAFSCHYDVAFSLFFHLRDKMGLWFWYIHFF